MSRSACWTVRTVSAGPLARSLATGEAAGGALRTLGHPRRPRGDALWRSGRGCPLLLRRVDRDGRKRRRCTGLSNRRSRRKDSGGRQHDPARTAPREHGMTKHRIFLTPAQGPALLNCVNRRSRGRTDRSVFVRSGNGRRRARLRRRAGAGTAEIEQKRVPNHRFGLAVKRKGQRGLRCIERRPRVQDAADRAAAIVSLMGPGPVALADSGAALPWQITAPVRGSEAAMLAAQQAPIGAKICTASANRTMGRKFLSRRRIATPIRRHLITRRVRSRDQVPCTILHAATNSLVSVHSSHKPARESLTLLPYPARVPTAALQPKLVQSQSFRRLLEF